jgi:hypothetical protein
MESARAIRRQVLDYQLLVRNLTSGFAAALLHRKPLDRRNAVPPGPQCIRRFRQTAPERADHTSGDHGDACAPFCCLRLLAL